MQRGRWAVSKALSLVCFAIRPATIFNSVMQDVSSQARWNSACPLLFSVSVRHFPKLFCISLCSEAALILHPWAKHYCSWDGDLVWWVMSWLFTPSSLLQWLCLLISRPGRDVPWQSAVLCQTLRHQTIRNAELDLDLEKWEAELLCCRCIRGAPFANWV